MIDTARRQGDDHPAWCGDVRLATRVRKAHDAIGVRHVQRVADQGNSKRRMKPGQEHRPCLGDAIAVAVAKKDDPVLARYGSSGFRPEGPEGKTLAPPPVCGSR